MDSTIPTFRPDVVALQTLPRPTAPPVRVSFSEVLTEGTRALVAGAQAAMRALPGAPVVAAAVRAGTAGPGTAPVGTLAPEGPSASGAGAGPASMVPLLSAPAAQAPGYDGSVESSIAQSQQMNLYYLQVQEQVNDQNRAFTLLSNVLEVEHNTAKSAIGNIH
jgi:hypothetical protein